MFKHIIQIIMLLFVAKDQDYDRFYNGELILRKNLNYPPFAI